MDQQKADQMDSERLYTMSSSCAETPTFSAAKVEVNHMMPVMLARIHMVAAHHRQTNVPYAALM